MIEPDWDLLPIVRKQIMFDVLEAVRDGDVVPIERNLADDVVYGSKVIQQYPDTGNLFSQMLESPQAVGKGEVQASLERVYAAFQILQYEVCSLLADGECAAARTKWRLKVREDESTLDGESFQWWYFRGTKILRVDSLSIHLRRLLSIEADSRFRLDQSGA